MQKLQIDDISIPIISLQTLSLPTIGVAKNKRGGSAGNNDWYIQRGLVFHLDGIDKGPNEGMWTDLQMGYKFSPVEDTVFGENYVNGLLECSEMIDVPAHDGTIEIVFKPLASTTDNQSYFLVGKESSIAFGFAHGTAITKMGNKEGQQIIFPIGYCNELKPYAVSANEDECLVSLADGAFSSKTGNFWIIRNPDVMRINSGSNMADIYSIRVYNRKLSQFEMRNNQNVDKKRFNLDFLEKIFVYKDDGVFDGEFD